MMKTSVKFQKNRNKTEGGVAHTRYILLYGDGRTDGQTHGRTDGWMDGKPKNLSLRFSSKRRGTIKMSVEINKTKDITRAHDVNARAYTSGKHAHKSIFH